MTTMHTRQLQQYTQDNYNNKHGQPTKIKHDNLKLRVATIHTRQIRIQTSLLLPVDTE